MQNNRSSNRISFFDRKMVEQNPWQRAVDFSKLVDPPIYEDIPYPTSVNVDEDITGANAITVFSSHYTHYLRKLKPVKWYATREVIFTVIMYSQEIPTIFRFVRTNDHLVIHAQCKNYDCMVSKSTNTSISCTLEMYEFIIDWENRVRMNMSVCNTCCAFYWKSRIEIQCPKCINKKRK